VEWVKEAAAAERLPGFMGKSGKISRFGNESR
jgi:hypothetical protein